MNKTRTQKKLERRKAKKTARKLKMIILTQSLIYFRMLIDFLIDFIFSLFYGNKKEIIPPIKQSFLSESAVVLAKKIREGALSSEEVVRAYIERIKDVNNIINAVIDHRFGEAIEEAKKVDQDLSEKKFTEEDFKKKPFLGVPFTTKESTACAGLSWTYGIVSRSGIKAKEDADVVEKMKEAGGILIANTNIPEFNLWQETRNKLFGQTSNPYDTTRTVGGSSGGEAALIASCASAIGIGTDIGGSIRMPCFFCGIFGHKPSPNLINTKGLTRRTGEEKDTMVVGGPMARHAQDLIPMLKVLCGPNLKKLRLDDNVDVLSLKFCFVDENNDLRSSSMGNEMKSVMAKVINHLNDQLKDGEIVQKLSVEEFRWSHQIWRYWLSQEGMNFANEMTNRQGELNAWSELLKKLCGMSNCTMAAIYKLFDDQILPPVNEQWARETTKTLKENLLSEITDHGVLLYPSYNWPAPYHYTALTRPFNFSYWSIFNALKFPATQVPLGLSKDGLPVGIQVVAAPYNDHLTLAVAKYLEKQFGGYVTPF